jgi:ribose transport system substrate-binding protein
MSGQRLTLWIIALVAIVAAIGYRMSVMRQPPPPPTSKVAFVASGSGPFWQAAINGAKAAADKENVDLRIETPKESENIEEQMSILVQINTDKELAGIALSPIDAERQTPLINQMIRRDKRVVTFDSDAPLSMRQRYIGTNNLRAGEICASLVKEALPEGGKVAVLLANLTKQNMLDRKEGFEARLAEIANSENGAAPLEVVEFSEDNGSRKKCEQNIQDTLAKHPDLSCFVGMTARHGPILLAVLKDLGKLGQIKLVTFDDAEETLRGIEEGNIYATVAQDPYMYGYEAVSTLASLCRGDETVQPLVGSSSIFVEAEPIRQDNLDDFRARLKAREKSAKPEVASEKST